MRILLVACVLCAAASCSTPTATPPAAVPSTTSTAHVVPGPAPAVPRPDHVVVVVEENRSYADVIGRRDAPYLNSLAVQ